MITPLPWQNRALQLPEATEDGRPVNLALLTGRGPGKSTLLRLLILRHLVEHGTNARALLVRKSYKALTEHEDELERLFNAAWPGRVRYNRAERIFRTPSGGTCELGQLDGPGDYSKYQGRETRLLVLDEITEWASLRYVNLLASNLRGPGNVPLRTVVAGNPGGPGHGLVSKRWVDGRRPWHLYEGDDGAMWITVSGVSHVDNSHLGDPDRYRRQLEAACGGDKALASAWIDGDWSEIRGAFFAGVFGAHNLIAAGGWKVPGPVRETGWMSFLSVDWGQSAPAVAHLWAMPLWPGLKGPGGRVFPKYSRLVLEEVHTADPEDPSRGLNWPVSMFAEEITEACRRRDVIRWGVADDARGLGDETLLGEFKRFGLAMERPQKSRVGGWTKLRELMFAASLADPDRAGLWIDEQCRFTLETVPVLPRDPIRIEDVNTSANDHAADSLRYGAMHNQSIPRSRRSVHANALGHRLDDPRPRAPEEAEEWFRRNVNRLGR